MSTPSRLRRRPQLSEEVAAHLRHAIMTAEIRPGEFIRMDDMAARLGVSVAPVREAAGIAAYLAGDYAEAIAELRTVRRMITDEDLAALAACNERLRRAVAAGDVDEIVDAEFDFHRTHNRIAGSGKLAWFLLNATHYTPHRLYAADPAWGSVAVDSHAKLIEGYRAGDRTAITDQVRRQFDDGARRLAARLTATGIWDAEPSR